MGPEDYSSFRWLSDNEPKPDEEATPADPMNAIDVPLYHEVKGCGRNIGWYPIQGNREDYADRIGYVSTSTWFGGSRMCIVADGYQDQGWLWAQAAVDVLTAQQTGQDPIHSETDEARVLDLDEDILPSLLKKIRTQAEELISDDGQSHDLRSGTTLTVLWFPDQDINHAWILRVGDSGVVGIKADGQFDVLTPGLHKDPERRNMLTSSITDARKPIRSKQIQKIRIADYERILMGSDGLLAELDAPYRNDTALSGLVQVALIDSDPQQAAKQAVEYVFNELDSDDNISAVVIVNPELSSR